MPEKHHPTPEERDERVSVELDAQEFIEGVLATGPLPADEDEGKQDQPGRGRADQTTG